MRQTNFASQPSAPSTQTTFVRWVFAILVLCFCAGTFFVCTHLYKIDTKVVLAEQSAFLLREARNTVNAVVAFREALRVQSERISSSELLRLYAVEAEADFEYKGGKLDAPDTTPAPVATLAGQEGLLRRILQDFVSEAGFEAASIVSGSGRVLLATEDQAAISTPQFAAVRQALEARTIRFAPLRVTPQGLTADFALPLQPQLARDAAAPPRAALVVSVLVTERFEQLLSVTDSMDRLAGLRVLQRFAAGWQSVTLQGVSAVDTSIVPPRDANGHIPFGRRTALVGGMQVYSQGLAVPDSEWWVVASVLASTVESALRTRAVTLGIVGALICLVFALCVPVVWWFAVGRNQHATALHFRTMYHTIERQKQLLERQQAHTLSALVRAIEGLDPYLVGHSQMMQALGSLLARRLGLDELEIRAVETAAGLSQVGRLALPHDLATKQGRFTAEELKEIHRIPEYAHTILRDIDFDSPVAETVYTMNERLDGTGYPQQLVGDAIRPSARVLGVLNAFCAMTSPRSYRDSMSSEKALEILRGEPGFDQDVVQVLQETLHSEKGAQIFSQYHPANNSLNGMA